MRKLIIAVLSFVLVMTLLVCLFLCWISEPLPEGKKGPEATLIAEKMAEALNKPAFDSIHFISWEFGNHRYEWFKKVDSVQVNWAKSEVFFSTITMQGSAKENGVILIGDLEVAAIQKAWAYFANDSFWLVAPYKIRDPGTVLTSIELPTGHGLLVTFLEGGVTPGDSYLWMLDDNYFPIGWKMWVKILPVGGVKSKWLGWHQDQGAWFPGNFQTLSFFKRQIKSLEVRS